MYLSRPHRMQRKVPIPGLRQKPGRKGPPEQPIVAQFPRNQTVTLGASNFELFSALPKELRLKIWELSLPDPKILELCLRVKDLPSDYPDREVPKGGTYYDNDNWQWVSISPTFQPKLLLVCQESHEVARNSYELLKAYDRSKKLWRAIYWDYSRDCFYFSARAWELLSDTAVHRFPSMKQLPMDASRTRRLAVDSHVPHVWISNKFPGYQQFLNPGGRDIAIRRLSHVLAVFQSLKYLFLTIDGRASNVGGTDLLITATSNHDDYYVEGGREMYLRWIPDIMEELRARNSNLHVPAVCLKLLVNGEPLEALERRWDYYFARCHFCLPDFTGHRYISRSPTPDDWHEEVPMLVDVNELAGI